MTQRSSEAEMKGHERRDTIVGSLKEKGGLKEKEGDLGMGL